MDKVQPIINDTLERFNSLSRQDKYVGAIGLATVVVLTSYLSKSPKKVQYPRSSKHQNVHYPNKLYVSLFSFCRTSLHLYQRRLSMVMMVTHCWLTPLHIWTLT